MFYSNQILARKGPLGLVWIAAHMEGRLKRQQINSTSIPASVDTLLDPEVPLALRLSGQLLLGVVRIYARKVAYLQQDCDAALVKIRVALRPADHCNLPPGSQAAPVEAITLLDPAAAAVVAERTRKARAAKAGGGDGKNNAAAAAGGGAAPAVIDGWLGPVDEDGVMLGLDDIAWEQEVLLGDGSEAGMGGFGAHFEPNRLSFGFTPSKSGLGSQDVSGVFGMYSSQGDMESFDVEDEEAAAVWDLDELEVERLRAAPSQSQGGRDSLGGLMGGDTPAGGKAAPAASEGGATECGPGHDGFTPGSLLEGGGPADSAEGPGQQDGMLPSTMDLDLDIDPAGALPPTPQAGAEEDAAAAAAVAAGGDGAGAVEELQGDPLSLDDLGDLGDMLPPTLAAEDDDQAAAGGAQEDGGRSAAAMDVDDQQPPAAAAAAAGTPTKTFQRRNTRQQGKDHHQQQQQQGEEGQAGGAAAAGAEAGSDAEDDGAAAAATAAKSARKRRVSGLLGQKRRVVIDAGGAAAGGRPGGRHAPTELPAAEIRALLADRAPLMDMERVHKVSRQLQQQAASSLSAQGAAALAQQQLLAITSAAAGASAAAAAAAHAPAGSPVPPAGAAAAAAAAAGPAFAPMPGVPGLGLSLGASFAGGLGLPMELQQLFSSAAAAAPAPAAAAAGSPAAAGASAGRGAAAAAAGGGEAEAVAPTAPLEEIGGFGDEAEELEGFGGQHPGAPNPALAGGVTRCSLSLSLTRTPGSAAAAGASGLQPTPGTDAGTVGPAGYTPGTAGGSFPGGDGYTPGSAGGFGAPGGAEEDAACFGAPDDVLQPLDDANHLNLGGQDDMNLNLGGPEDELGAWGGQAGGGEEEDQEGKENPPPGSGAAGKGTGAGGVGRMVWPADAETLLEQEAADREVPDGSFTSRTRLVVHHLQRAAAAAAGSSAGAYGSGAAGMTPTIGSKRRISAAAAGLAGTPGVAGKEGEGAAAAGPVLSFDGITRGHGRLDACRWFYEVLVLSNKGLVQLQQEESYGDISVTPNVAGMARV